MLRNICSPALLYLAYSLTQIIIDIFRQLYNTAFIKFIVMIIFTILLNILCNQGLCERDMSICTFLGIC